MISAVPEMEGSMGSGCRSRSSSTGWASRAAATAAPSKSAAKLRAKRVFMDGLRRIGRGGRRGGFATAQERQEDRRYSGGQRAPCGACPAGRYRARGAEALARAAVQARARPLLGRLAELRDE